MQASDRFVHTVQAVLPILPVVIHILSRVWRQSYRNFTQFYGKFGSMPPDVYSSITATDEVFEQLVAVMVEYDCDGVADAVEIASAIPLKRDKVELAQVLTN